MLLLAFSRATMFHFFITPLADARARVAAADADFRCHTFIGHAYAITLIAAAIDFRQDLR